MPFNNKFLRDYAKEGRAPRDEKEKKNMIRQYPNNNPKQAKGKTNDVNDNRA